MSAILSDNNRYQNKLLDFEMTRIVYDNIFVVIKQNSSEKLICNYVWIHWTHHF